MPVRRVEIAAFPSGPSYLADVPSTTSDDDGWYEIRGLRPGPYRIRAARGGFVDAWYGQRHVLEPGSTLQIEAGHSYDAIDFALTRSAAVSGTVLDHYGAPATGAAVETVRVRHENGIPVIRTMAAGANLTDDRGEFRISGLPPGKYFVSARPNPGFDPSAAPADVAFLPTYYPGAGSVADARSVDVGQGEEAFLTFAMVPARPVAVEGVVLDTAGTPVRGIPIECLVRTPGVITTTGSTYSNAAGRFRIPNLAPGEYDILATSPAGHERAARKLSLNGEDVTGLVLQLAKSIVVRGRIRFSPSNNARPLPSGIRIEGKSPDDVNPLGSLSAVPHDDWTFEAAVPPAMRWLIRVTAPSAWTIRSVKVGGWEVIDVPVELKADSGGIEVELTDQVSSISGVVTDSPDGDSGFASVLIASTDGAKWGPYTRFVRRVQTDRSGSYSVLGLPAGSYAALALDHLESGEEGNPAVLRRVVEFGTRIAIEDGESRTLDLALIREGTVGAPR